MQHKFKVSEKIFITSITVSIIVALFVIVTPYDNCYLFSLGVKDGYTDALLNTLPEPQRQAVLDGLLMIDHASSGSPEIIQSVSYNQCLKTFPDLPEKLTVHSKDEA